MTLLEAGYFLGKLTNNVAEYRALIRGVEAAIAVKPDEVRIYSDSELLVRQITGSYRVKSPDLQPLYAQAQALLLRLDSWQICHVYREQNRRADELANLAMDARKDVIVQGAGANAAAEAEAPVGTGAAPAPTKTRTAKGAAASRAGKTPRWTATFERAPGASCPAPCAPGREFTFGPTTPEGFCLYAAQAVLEELPLRGRAENDSPTSANCDRCGAPVRLDPHP
jgi:ribonuclease HI